MDSDAEIFEKFTKYGIDSLANRELVSAVLDPQITGELDNAYDMDFRKIASKEWKQIRYDSDLNDRKAQRVDMLFGLSGRIQEAEIGYKVQITSPQDAVGYLKPKLSNLTKEHFMVVFLDNAKNTKGYHTISSGGSTATIVDPAEVMRQAVINEANSILLAHNHPSGSVKESKADINLTGRMRKVGKLLGIPIDDHIIIAGDSFTSFKAKGLLN